MVATAGGLRRRHNGVCRLAKDDVHAHGQRSEGVLLRTAEERKAVVQARQEGSRQVLLHGHVSADYVRPIAAQFCALIEAG